ncbi:MAG TPA: ribonuclease J [Candidatus Absconditabacterales bacterium]|nr:ribonuclease J [Candidatus Absconditabacterales bacterium]HPK27998.1 ribonuclease J [Candidatus Absconditabacterales bacterium]
MMSENNLFGNLNIDFSKKNKQKRGRQNQQVNGALDKDLTSEAFLRHLGKTELDDIKDPHKLIKKGEKPVKIGSLMGLEQVGQCMFVEYENDLIIIDAAMEFTTHANFGADYIIPDISYVKKNIKKLRGIIITHGHLDHVGSLRDILPELGYPMIYTTPLSLGIIKKTFENPKDSEKIRYKIIDPDVDILKLGCFTLEFVPVNHNIPETLAVSIHTPKGIIFNSADFKIDHTPAIDRPADLAKIARIGAEGVKLYIGDSLGSNKKGRSISEKEIGENLDELIQKTKTRILIATFASNVGRIIQIVNSAIKANKTIFLSGRSMVNNIEICQQLGYIKVPKGYIRKLNEEVDTFPDDQVLILSTGAQGEEFAALTRMSRNEHNFLQLRKGDTILMSATPIPGNEGSVNTMINNLIFKDIHLITNDDIDVHASGHGCMEDHKLMLSLLRPEFFLPYFMPAKERYAHKNLAMDMGMPESRILMPMKNGEIIEMYDDVVLIGKEKLKLDTVMVDGKGKGHMSGEYVIKARSIMAEDGVLALIFKVDAKSKELVGNIQIESRGFVYSSEVKDIHTKVVEFARAKYVENSKRKMPVKDNLKILKEDLGEFIMQIIGRVPMIMPMFVYINKDSKDDVSRDEAILGMTLDEQGGE